MSVIDDLLAAVEDHQNQISDLADNADQNNSDVEDMFQQLQDQLSADEENIGQLSFPLSQDTIDLINEVISNFLTLPFTAATQALFESIFTNFVVRNTVTLVSGQKTVTDASVTTSSVIMLSYATRSGSLGILYVSGQTTGSFVINSRKTDDSGINTSDTSNVNYVVLN